MLSFTECMAQGRDLAQVARNRGQHTGRSAAGWNVKRPIAAANDNAAWLAAWRRDWRKQCAEILNSFRVATMSGPADCDHKGNFYDTF